MVHADFRFGWKEIQRRLALERVVANFSSRFSTSSTIDDAINAALADIGEFTGASRSYLFLLQNESQRLDNTHEWCAPGVTPQKENLQDLSPDQAPWWMATLYRGEAVNIPDVSSLNGDKAAAREILEPQDIKSLLALPVYAQGKLAGFLGLDNVVVPAAWREEDLLLLRLCAEIVGREIEREHTMRELKQIELLLQQNGDGPPMPAEKVRPLIVPPHGSPAKINTCRTLLDLVGEEILADVVGEYLGLLKSSVAVYEKNGDYAMSALADPWCRFLNDASRKLCDTADNRRAMRSGKWHCHESCWTKCGRVVIEEARPVDVECLGGVHKYGVPIFAGGEVVGALTFGYGDPPTDHESLLGIAERYGVEVSKLASLAQPREPRPGFIVAVAKRRLQRSARLIGEIVQRKRAERLKEEYISLISHDLRQPLTVVMGMAQWLHRRALESDAEAEVVATERILKSSKRMTYMIRDMVESARLEIGSLSLQKEVVDLSSLCGNIGGQMLPEADRQRVCVDCSARVPVVLADRGLIERAIVNLVVNALKYSPPETRVTLSACAIDGEVSVSVADAGSGIPREDLPYLFERFHRAKTGKKTDEGLGLGLYVARLIAEAHGGRISVQSECGKGSTFTLALPLNG
ncbi:MAG: GAF domain-containing sensor histidine kinase [Dehalococcoidales bacterium]|nr:GAF domain-containing sensor histidine kinase [Dehalococcoidales bacterium]